MKLRIEITMDNAAFGDCDQDAGAEASRILADLGKHLAAGDDPWPCSSSPRRLMDSNGNAIGTARITR